MNISSITPTITAKDSYTDSNQVNGSALNGFPEKAAANAMMNSGLAQMQLYAQGLSGLATKTSVAAMDSEDDSEWVDFSDIEVFFSKVEAGTVTDSDLAQMQERFSSYKTQHVSFPHDHHGKQSSERSALESIREAGSPLSAASNMGSARQSLRDDRSRMEAYNMNNFNRPIFDSII